MKLIFMGTPLFACYVFDELILHHEILAVFTQPDKPVGRKNIITPPPIKQKALQHHIKIYQPTMLGKDEIEAIASLKPDMIVVVAYGKILPESILKIAPCVNVHASILPKYRGASPIQQMLLSDDKEFGVTIIHMDKGLDSGDILMTKTITRDSVENMGLESLSQKLSLLGASALLEVLEHYQDITPIPQDSTQATYCKKITKSDGLIDFDDAKEIFKKSLAYEKWPGIYIKSGIKLFHLTLCKYTGTHIAGEILQTTPHVIIGCKKGSLIIESIQAPSKQKILAADFLRGRGLKVGDILQ